MSRSEQRAATAGRPSPPPSLTIVVPATNGPATLERCLRAIAGAQEGAAAELVVVDGPPDAGPAEARNLGAERASGDVLVFVDADVEVHPDAFRRIRAAFAADPGLTALFGSYDDEPPAPGAVSAFRNLLHHHVHHEGAGPAGTFWAGLGAVRRDAFLTVGGFDLGRFPRPSVEDIDLGMRLTAAGARIVLDPTIQGTHLKGWTLGAMIRTDFSSRGVPWVALLLRDRRASSELNLGWTHRLSTASCVAGLGAAALGRYRLAAGSAIVFVTLNRRFYALLSKKRGAPEAVLGVGLHALHHLTGAAALAAGLLRHALAGDDRESHGR